jgi:hypothetical protein
MLRGTFQENVVDTARVVALLFSDSNRTTSARLRIGKPVNADIADVLPCLDDGGYFISLSRAA